jgi:diguanylate cyclase (GGDEF)-like protein
MSSHPPGPEPSPSREGRRLGGLQGRIILFVVGLLIPILGSVLLVVNEVNSRNARAAIDDGLEIGERVFERLLEQNNRQLAQAADILSLDFAFRQAVATRDLRTTESVLANHGARIGADLIVLLSLDGKAIADTLGGKLLAQPFPFPWLIEAAEREGRAAGMGVSDGQLYQLVLVPVRAPEPIAWAAFGFLVRDRLDRELQGLTRLNVSFFGRTSGEAEWVALDSTLPPAQLEAQRLGLGSETARERRSTTIRSELGEYRTLVMPLPQRGAIALVATLAQSVDEVLAPYRRLERILLLVGAAALAIAVIGGIMIARSITRPIHLLARMSQRIEEGDFTHAVEIRRKDEIGELARSFDHMRRGLATREDQIMRLAYRDALTDLPNRTLFNDRLGMAIKAAQRERRPLAVLLLDLDRFKQINDTLGHQVGDQVLQQAAKRLVALVRRSDTIARLGGDEFIILVNDCEPDEAKQIAQKVLGVLEEPIVIAEHSLDVRASIGIAGYPADSEDPDMLMRHADLAMYVAKRGNLGLAAYEAAHGRHRMEQLSLLSELRRAIEHEELRLVFQPKIDMRSEEIVGAEALVRWKHPERGFVPPNDFIPFAEQTGFIKSITRWVIDAAAAQCSRWRADGMSLKLVINISVQDLLDPGMPEALLGSLQRSDMSTRCLGLEITESGVMQDQAAAIAVLKRLRLLDIDLSIDDFGTGHSSLAYLKQLQVTELKIDRSFVRNLVQDEKDRAIVLSVIELAHNLGLSVVAEGVEDRSTLEVLKKLGCDVVQGYVFAKPLLEKEFREWFAAWKPAGARHATKV